jgi:two-component system response regulator HydG
MNNITGTSLIVLYNSKTLTSLFAIIYIYAYPRICHNGIKIANFILVKKMTEKLGKILIVDDDVDILKAAKFFLEQYIKTVHIEHDPKHISTLLKNESYDVILLDMNFTYGLTAGTEGIEWLKKILKIDPASVVVMITAYGDIDVAVKAIKEGANNFILKPWNNEKLLSTILSAITLRKSLKEIDSLRSRQRLLYDDLDKPFHNFIGQSQKMKDVFEIIKKVAVTDANVLITGENGTGKELAARAVHRFSKRKDEPFINVDMGAIAESLFESELFGHKRGAFTDAREDKAGRIEIASGGTLFLDEIGNLPLSLQSKVLTILEKRELIRLGENKPRPFDIRLISATNMSLYEKVELNLFRQDLLYRINTVEIILPPLRQRIDDVPILADHFLNLYCKKYNKELKNLSPHAMKKLQLYHWPGNVRELQHAIERAVIMSETKAIQPTDVAVSSSPTAESETNTNEYNLEDVEKKIIRKSIERHKGNISKAAVELGLSRAALYRKMEKYGI